MTTAIRLVKGAYREPASIAIERKADVDEAYFRLSESLLGHVAKHGITGGPPAIATHDLGLLQRIDAMAAAKGATGSYEVQMLYGIRRDAQSQLARDRRRLRVLISYGDAWFPWYMRRLAERPANVLFLLKSLAG